MCLWKDVSVLRSSLNVKLSQLGQNTPLLPNHLYWAASHERVPNGFSHCHDTDFPQKKKKKIQSPSFFWHDNDSVHQGRFRVMPPILRFLHAIVTIISIHFTPHKTIPKRDSLHHVHYLITFLIKLLLHKKILLVLEGIQNTSLCEK